MVVMNALDYFRRHSIDGRKRFPVRLQETKHLLCTTVCARTHIVLQQTILTFASQNHNVIFGLFSRWKFLETSVAAKQSYAIGNRFQIRFVTKFVGLCGNL